MLGRYQCLSREQLQVYYDSPDRAFAEEVSTILAKASAALTTYLEVSSPIPTLRAVLAPNRDAFDVLVADLLGLQIERPSDPRRIAQPQNTDMIFLSPAAYGTQSSYRYDPEDFSRMVYHELVHVVHVVQEYLSPAIEESPFWWDEGLAVYLSDQWKYESQFRFREPVLESIEKGTCPTLSEIQAEPSLGYEFGWTIVRFIEQRHGQSAIAELVKEVDNGDVLTALGVEANRFLIEWRTWLISGEGSQM